MFIFSLVEEAFFCCQTLVEKAKQLTKKKKENKKLQGPETKAQNPGTIILNFVNFFYIPQSV